MSTTERHFLVIDVGNTTAHFGICTRERVVDQFRVPSNPRAILGEGIRRVKKVSRAIHLIPRVLISSVVPQVNPALARLCRAAGFQPHWLGHRTATGLRLLYKKPSEIGADRIANALAAKEIYGAPAIVVDMGTAITFDCLSRSGAYMGGVIAPGLRLSCEALAERTGLLPLVDIKIPPGFMGKSTIHAIQSGIVHGTRALIAGIIAGLRREMGGRPRVILTGGQLELIVRGWRHPGIIDPFLTLHGLRIAYNKTVVSSE
ncbi:MAG: type III pantothenate kinase [Candidatus Aureabacteria bacterium]|nr:type III pantothenate kinase [Candidatus Auribacterota bacterium]